jgi:guanylate kinase
MEKGLLIVISGPSGAGKGTVIHEFLKQYGDNTDVSVSCTTRDPRGNEVDGVNYFFKTEEEFTAMIQSGDFLEYAHVFGKYYGTPKKLVLDKLAAGKNVILEIDVQGAVQIKKNMKDSVLIFILPPSMKELYNRLSGRSTETPQLITKRYNMAKNEIEFARKYDFAVQNRTVAQSAADINCIVRAMKMAPAQTHIIEKLLNEGEKSK